jgi:DNA-binding beta-propeller fold protein YncE
MRVRLLTAVALLATTACLSPIDPSTTGVAAVHATIGDGGFSIDTIQVRATTRVHASALAAAGYDLGDIGFTYTSSNTDVAVVDGNGTVRGIAVGSAIITATAPKGGSAATVSVLVVPSTIAYTIDVGGSPGPIAFSTDYTRAYVATANDSLVVIDALGFFRTNAAPIGDAASGIAATTDAVYVTHSASDSVSRVTTGSTQSLPDVFVGAGPGGIVARGPVAMVAARYDRRIAIVEGGTVTASILLAGEPHELALDRDGATLFATVDGGGGDWRVEIMHPASGDTSGSFAVAPGPTAIAASANGDRVYLLYPGEQLVRVYTLGSGGWALQGSVATGASPGGIAARHVGDISYVVASGEPATLFDGVSLEVYDRIAGAGTGPVAIRPDGLFAFVSAPGTTSIHVLGL